MGEQGQWATHSHCMPLFRQAAGPSGSRYAHYEREGRREGREGGMGRREGAGTGSAVPTTAYTSPFTEEPVYF